MELLTNIKPLVIIIHAFAGAIGIGATTVTDTLFFKFLSDRVVTPGEKNVMDVLSKILWIALTVLIITGVLLFLSDTARYAASSKFIVKMIIVGIIFINGLLLNFVIGPNLEKLSFKKDSRGVESFLPFKRIAFVSGVVSISSWYASFLLGLLPSIPLTVGQGLLIYIGIVVCGGVLSQMVLRYFSQHS